MSMAEAVPNLSLRNRAVMERRARRARLMRGHDYSTELDIMSEAAIRRAAREKAKRDNEIAAQQRLKERIAAKAEAVKRKHKERLEQKRAWAERLADRGMIPLIITACCEHFRVSENAVRSARRQYDIVHVRHIAFYLACVLTEKTFPEIGRLMGDRDHTTIMHARRKIEAQLAIDPFLAANIAAIKQSLGVE